MGLLSRLKGWGNPKWTPVEFWNWFVSPDVQRVIYGMGLPGEEVNSRVEFLSKSLRKVHPELIFGISPASDDKEYSTLEISAGGIRSVIPAVLSLVAAAPQIDGWKVVAFKQPCRDFSVRLGPSKDSIDSSTVMVAPTKLPDGRYDLAVYVPTPADCPKNTTGELGFIFLDHILGEYAVMTRLGELTFDSTLVAPPGLCSLAEFAERLEGAS